MTGGPWFIWTGGRTAGWFPTFDAAMAHLRIVANDHRRKKELQQFAVGAWRYVGPRGRRHGTRLVAWICTLNGAELIGLSAISVGQSSARPRA